MSDTDEFSADEKAYFESGGASDAPQPETPAGGQPEGQEQPIEVGEEQPEGGEGASQGADKPKQTVPLATLLEERKAAKEDRERLREMERRIAVSDERWRMLEQASQGQQQPKGEEDPEPDPNVDIFAHQAWLGRQFAKQREVETQRQQQSEAQANATKLDQQVSDLWHGSAAEYAKTAPDFPDAASFLAKTRDRQLASMAGINPRLATEQGRNAVINEDLKQIIIAAAQNRQNPAEVVYAIAKEFGYTGKQADPQGDAATQQVAGLAAAVQGSKSLSQVGGGKVQTTSAQSIADMSDADFAKWLEKNPDGFRKIAG